MGEDGKPRGIISSDMEIDDMNSFIHQCFFSNEIDLAGIVVSGSFRRRPLNWLPNLWSNEYAEVYPTPK